MRQQSTCRLISKWRRNLSVAFGDSTRVTGKTATGPSICCTAHAALTPPRTAGWGGKGSEASLARRVTATYYAEWLSLNFAATKERSGPALTGADRPRSCPQSIPRTATAYEITSPSLVHHKSSQSASSFGQRRCSRE